MTVYALCVPLGGRMLIWAGAALVFALLIAAVQLLPTSEANALREFHEGYGAGIRDLKFYISYLIPNFYDFGLNTPVFTHGGYEYLYLGAPAFFGLFWAAVRLRALRAWLPITAVGLASVVLVTNPYDLIWTVIQHSKMLAQVCRSWYFLAGITASLAILSAVGIDQFLRRQSRAAPSWIGPLAIAILIGWSIHQLWLWRPHGAGFPTGWKDAVDPLVMLTAFSLAMWAIRSASGRLRVALAAALLLGVGIDYKVNGTSKRINAAVGNADQMFAQAAFPGMDDAVYQQLHEHAEYRVALDNDNPVPMDLRHYGLTTPQGVDPLAPEQYHRVLAPQGAYYDPLVIDPANEEMLQLLGVRYLLTSEDQPLYSKVKDSPLYRLLEPSNSYFKTFEYLHAQPPYHWDGAVTFQKWLPEDRQFKVSSPAGGRFVLVEQHFPGWSAAMDGKPAPLELYHDAFQAIMVPPGEHQLRFTYRSRGLRIGGVISLLTLAALGVLLLKTPPKRTPKTPAVS